MTKLSDILPKKKELTHDRMSPCGNDYYEGYNDSIDDCHTALEQAMKEGKLCWVPSEQEIYDQILSSDLRHVALTYCSQMGMVGRSAKMSRELAQALIQLLKNGERNEGN